MISNSKKGCSEIIRLATIDDIEKVFSLMASFRDHHHLEDPNDAQLLENIRYLITDQQSDFIVYETAESVVAYVLLRYRFNPWFSGREAYIEDLYVHNEYRNRGLGRKLLHHVIDKAESTGIVTICLHTNENNHGSNRLYTSKGFKSASAHYENGRQIFYRKRLNPD